MKKAKNNAQETDTSAAKRLWLDELTMREAEKAAKIGKVVIVPIGSVEEHGDHLPLCTDSLQPEHVALEVARRKNCLVAPIDRSKGN